MSTADHYLAALSSYQSLHGHGKKPPVLADKALSNWIVNRVRRFRRRAASDIKLASKPPSDISRLAELGLICLDRNDPRYVLADADPHKPRGFVQSAHAVIERCNAGAPPSLLSDSSGDRHLALWAVRIMSGVLADNHVGVHITSKHQSLLSCVWDAFILNTPATQIAIEWVAFCARLFNLEHYHHLSHTHAWHLAAVRPSHTTLLHRSRNFPLLKDLPTLTRRIAACHSLDGISVHSAASIIPFLNATLSTGPRPVSFRTDRVQSRNFDLYLRKLDATFYPRIPGGRPKLSRLKSQVDAQPQHTHATSTAAPVASTSVHSLVSSAQPPTLSSPAPRAPRPSPAFGRPAP